MLHTVEAEVGIDGSVRLLEPLPVAKPSRALVTLLENVSAAQNGNAATMLKFLRENRLPTSSRPSEFEIEAQVLEARESWE